MSYGIDAIALALLNAETDLAVPLSRLRHMLQSEVGPELGAAVSLANRIRERSDLFLLVEPEPTPWSTDEWPEESRAEYQDALRHLGLVQEPRITTRRPDAKARPESGPRSFLRQLDSSLIDLWQAADEDADLRDQVTAAFAQSDLIRAALNELEPRSDHPTTPPRDPRRGDGTPRRPPPRSPDRPRPRGSRRG